ncbi:aldo/keto reductase [Devosia sediminis]|uniref:Aldo/keto reductase n=1 Tax=Devosia sediminis TaxID=2798801 RepID=A0A934IVE5_9HYPH|nr:aldo/keto reductase [Devosia sediminis]MBJ3783493.1 aldo/keto reductase [Devosia sediminis]
MTQSYTLNTGAEIPAVGLGVYRSSPEETTESVETALRLGYRLIDTAAAYRNEEQVGQGLLASGVPRDEVFIESKLWISDYTYDGAVRGVERSLRKLGLDHVDLYLLHQPTPDEFERTLGAWKALTELAKGGQLRAIGVSNFNEAQLQKVMDETGVVPAVNQIELHPFYQRKGLTEFHRQHGIVTQAWSPIGGVARYYTDKPNPEHDPLTHPVVVAIADRHHKTAAQVILRWHLQLSHQVIPKSVKAARIAENFDVFDFTLAVDEMAQIDALDQDRRGGPDPQSISTKTYPFVIPD